MARGPIQVLVMRRNRNPSLIFAASSQSSRSCTVGGVMNPYRPSPKGSFFACRTRIDMAPLSSGLRSSRRNETNSARRQSVSYPRQMTGAQFVERRDSGRYGQAL
jgi:hypothetical protein